MPKGAKYGGRQKGSLNKDKKELRDLLNEHFPNYHPVLAMTEIANDKKNAIDIRLIAHKEVAKYVCPQLKAIEHSGTIETNKIVVRVNKR